MANKLCISKWLHCNNDNVLFQESSRKGPQFCIRLPKRSARWKTVRGRMELLIMVSAALQIYHLFLRISFTVLFCLKIVNHYFLLHCVYYFSKNTPILCAKKWEIYGWDRSYMQEQIASQGIQKAFQQIEKKKQS